MVDNEELTIESITSTVETADALSAEQKTFLEEHKDELEPDVAERYGIEVKPPEPVIKKQDEGTAGDGGEGEGEGDDGEPDPEDVKVIEKVAKKIMAPYEAKAQAQQIETDIQAELTTHPEYKPYEKQIRAFVTHENRIGFIKNGLPVSSVVLEAIAPYLQKIGAEKERLAAEHAKSSQGGGSSARPAGGGAAKDWGKASKEEVAAKRAEIMGHP